MLAAAPYPTLKRSRSRQEGLYNRNHYIDQRPAPPKRLRPDPEHQPPPPPPPQSTSIVQFFGNFVRNWINLAGMKNPARSSNTGSRNKPKQDTALLELYQSKRSEHQFAIATAKSAGEEPPPEGQELRDLRLAVKRSEQKKEVRSNKLGAQQAGKTPSFYMKKPVMGLDKHRKQTKKMHDAMRDSLAAPVGSTLSSSGSSRTGALRKATEAEQRFGGRESVDVDEFRAYIKANDTYDDVMDALKPSTSLKISRRKGKSRQSLDTSRHPVDTLANTLERVRILGSVPSPQLDLWTYEKHLAQANKSSEPPKRKFRKLDSRMTQEAESVWRNGGFVSSKPGAEVTQRDVIRLKGLTWLNDEIITFYAALLNERSAAAFPSNDAPRDPEPAKGLLNVWVFNSYFYATFTGNKGYAGVKRWTKKTDIFKKDRVIIPINVSNSHWVCAAINFRLKRFEYFDSLGDAKPSVYRALRRYVAEEHAAKKKGEKLEDLSVWEDYWDQELPQQSNASDCGVFTCQFMESLSRNVMQGFDFTQKEMPYFRAKITLELKDAKLREEEWDR